MIYLKLTSKSILKSSGLDQFTRMNPVVLLLTNLKTSTSKLQEIFAFLLGTDLSKAIIKIQFLKLVSESQTSNLQKLICSLTVVLHATAILCSACTSPSKLTLTKYSRI